MPLSVPLCLCGLRVQAQRCSVGLKMCRRLSPEGSWHPRHSGSCRLTPPVFFLGYVRQRRDVGGAAQGPAAMKKAAALFREQRPTRVEGYELRVTAVPSSCLAQRALVVVHRGEGLTTTTIGIGQGTTLLSGGTFPAVAGPGSPPSTPVVDSRRNGRWGAAGRAAGGLPPPDVRGARSPLPRRCKQLMQASRGSQGAGRTFFELRLRSRSSPLRGIRPPRRSAHRRPRPSPGRAARPRSRGGRGSGPGRRA